MHNFDFIFQVLCTYKIEKWNQNWAIQIKVRGQIDDKFKGAKISLGGQEHQHMDNYLHGISQI